MIDQLDEMASFCERCCKKKDLTFKIMYQNKDTQTFLARIYNDSYDEYAVFDRDHDFLYYDSLKTAYFAYLEAQHFTVMLLENKGDVALYAVRHPVSVTTYLVWTINHYIDTSSLKDACDLYYKESGQTI